MLTHPDQYRAHALGVAMPTPLQVDFSRDRNSGLCGAAQRWQAAHPITQTDEYGTEAERLAESVREWRRRHPQVPHEPEHLQALESDLADDKLDQYERAAYKLFCYFLAAICLLCCYIGWHVYDKIAAQLAAQ